MNNAMNDVAVCGLDGCSVPSASTPPQTARAVKTGAAQKLTIISDVICPWCFVAKKNLEKALELAGNGINLEITWRPYELNPGMPKEGMDRRTYRSKKFGSWERSQGLDAQVAAAGEQAGITFRHDLMERTPNTFGAHRLIWLADQEHVQDAIVEALFSAYFVEGRDVGDKAVLAAIGQEAGLSEAGITAFLESKTGTEEVRREAANAQRSGISGVPTFILDGQQLGSGAMRPEVMAALLRETAAAHAPR